MEKLGPLADWNSCTGVKGVLERLMPHFCLVLMELMHVCLGLLELWLGA